MLAFLAGTFFILPLAFATTYTDIAAAVELINPTASSTPAKPAVPHQPTPSAVKGIYMTQCAVGTPSFRTSLVSLLDHTELNTIIIDIKDYTGYLAFPTEHPLLKDAVSTKCGADDMKEFIKTLHDKGVYVIGRITVFQDPRYTKLYPQESVQSISRPGEPWKDNKGLSFVSVASHQYWDFVVALSKESYDIGFDELNYDYIRWPSDGPMKDVKYPGTNRAEEVEKFWKHLYEQVHPIGVVMSADLFGYVTVLTDDLGIGQVLERALPYFDYIMPMVYPSHYNNGFAGIKNVNSDPYKVVHVSMVEAVRRTLAATTTVPALTHTPIMETVTIPAHDGVATTTEQRFSGLYSKQSYPASKMRPWLQDFNYPVPYTPEMVAAQIKATTDAGLNSYLFWDPANRYNSLRPNLAAEPEVN